MLGINPIPGGGQNYYIGAVAQGVDEYYRGVGEAPGWWAGSSAEVDLDLTGEVTSDDLQAIWDGLDPQTDEQLGRFTNRRVGGFDLCWRAPKSVSLLFAFGSPEISRAVRDAHDEAVAGALQYMESNAAGTRTGHGGVQMERVDGFVAALFRHRTSRSGDPHLHTHVLLANMAKTADGQWRTLDGRLLYHHAKTAGYLYQAQLRSELTQRLGVEWGPVEKGAADLAGVDRSVIWAFSERRRDIVEHMDKVGFHSARAAQIATLETRPDKTTPTRGTIHDVWEVKAVSIGFDPIALDNCLIPDRTHQFSDHQARRLFNHLAGPEGLTMNASTFDRRHIIQGIAAGLRQGAPVELVERLADAFLTRVDIVELGAGREFTHASKYSTTELMALETSLTTSALARADEGCGIARPNAISDAIARRPSMADEQTVMVERLCRDGAGVAVVAASAGTGKTFALDAAHEAWRESGYTVIGAALAAKAARELESASNIPSATLTRLTNDLERGRLKLHHGAIVVVDEAGMAGTRQLAPLLTYAHAAGAKVVLVGDPRQLPEIEAGGMLNALSRMLDPVTLAENRRQHEPWERQALAHLRDGDVGTALDAYEEHGRLVELPTSRDVRNTMASDWWNHRQRGEEVVMLATRNIEVDDLNVRARLFLDEHELLHGPVLQVNERPFQAGDEIICLRNNYRLGVRNGDRCTVERVDEYERTMVVRTQDGRRTLPTDYLDAGNIAHAYATTLHKAQGATFDRCLVYGTDDLYREAGYVAMSRGRLENVLYIAGAQEVEVDLPHAKTVEHREPSDLIRESLGHEHAKERAIDVADQLDDWGIGRSGRQRLLAQIEALDVVPLPDRPDDPGLGLGL